MRTLAKQLPLLARTLIAVTGVTLATWACSPSRTTAPATPALNYAPSPGAEIIPRWNAFARSLIVTAKPNQQEALRALAYLSLAQHEASIEASRVNLSTSAGTDGSTEILQTEVEVSAPGHVDRAAQLRGAIAGASAEILAEMFRTSGQAVTAALAAEALASTAAGEVTAEYEAGVAEGRRVGARIAAAARTDNFDAAWDGVIPGGQGAWFSSIGRPPLLPALGKMQPFFMRTGADFRPGPPPAIGSNAYNAALAEIVAFSDNRTAAQDSSAKFWAMATGPLVAGYWNEVATALIAKYNLNEMRAAHVLALMNTAAMDGNIACHDAKYVYWLIRPSQADPNIKTAIGLPNHPSYPSNHACLSGTAALILANEFPAERAQLERQANDATESRYYAGLHYRFDGDAGLGIARNVAALALRVDRDLEGRLALR